MNEPPIFSDEQESANTGRYIDAVVRLRTEASLQQTRIETARKIFEEIEANKWLCDSAGCLVIGVDDDDPDWQHLKAKYLGEQK